MRRIVGTIRFHGVRIDTLLPIMEADTLLPLAVLLFAAARSATAAAAPDDSGAGAAPEAPAPVRQLREEAWWTGPLLAASPLTLPPGHFLIEPYVYDSIPRGHYDNDGTRRAGPHANNFASQSYVLYGLLDDLSVGLIPRIGYNKPTDGLSSSGPGAGDLTLQASYALTHYGQGSWMPATAFVFQETLPVGKYDQLGNRPADGLGGGVYSSTLALYSQFYSWMPNGRILRTRLDFSYSIAGSAPVRDVSSYGTSQGFVGRVRPGDTALIDAAAEYSLTRNWVLALDVVYEHDANTRVWGADSAAQISLNSGAGHSWSLAPALEYNFNSRIGIIAGAKLTAAGSNASAEVIPVAAVNIVI